MYPGCCRIVWLNMCVRCLGHCMLAQRVISWHKVRVGAAFANHAWSCSGCIVGQHKISERTSNTIWFLHSLLDCKICQCPLLLPDDGVRVRHEIAVVFCLVGSKTSFSKTANVVDCGAVLAFVGAGLVGLAVNAFKTMGMAIALWLMEFLTIDLTMWDSYLSMSAAICALIHWCVGEAGCVQHSIWLGSSFGALAVSEAALLCESALARSRAIVGLDPRTKYPARPKDYQV